MKIDKELYSYIAIEGNIGAGKTSLATKLANEFNAKLILEQFEDNSFLPKFYIDPDRFAFPLELTFLAERYRQLRESLSMRDMFHSFVISDYLVTKSLIFASNTLQSDEYLLYKKLFDIIHQNVPKPDLIVYLYAEVDQLQRNIKKRGREYEQNIKNEYLEMIQNGYFDFIKQEINTRILIIDISNVDFVNCDNDFNRLIELIFKPYEIGVYRLTP